MKIRWEHWINEDSFNGWVCLCLCQWFEEKQQHFENLDVQLRKLHTSVESLVCHRKGTLSVYQNKCVLFDTVFFVLRM